MLFNTLTNGAEFFVKKSDIQVVDEAPGAKWNGQACLHKKAAQV
ncbi:hypothetical protein GGU45_003991 [Niabella hirudinis]